MSAGFPEECLLPQSYNFYGPDPKLDLVVALLTLGHYPNVCAHKEKRKVDTLFYYYYIYIITIFCI